MEITKLNIGAAGAKKLLSNTAFGSLMKDVNIDAIQPKETVYINPDNFMGVSDPVPSGANGEDSDPEMCAKLYITKDDYWVIDLDENYEALRDYFIDK